MRNSTVSNNAAPNPIARKTTRIGLTNCIEVAGGPFLRPAKDLSTLRFAEDGKLDSALRFHVGWSGSGTAFCQIVSERFGVPLENVLYEQGDTDQLPYGKGNGGSGALRIGGSAVMLAVDKVIERAKKLAAELLEAAVTDIELREGKFHIAGTDRSIDVAAVGRASLIPISFRPARKAA